MRIADWETRLAAAIDKHRALPFELGVSDCLELVLDAVEAETGENPAAEFRGSYRSEMEIARNLSRLGCHDLGDAMALFFPNEIAPSFVGRGDLVTIEQGGHVAAAICIGRHLVGKAEDGLTFMQRSLAVRAFRIN